MISRGELKGNAKKQLKRRWPIAIITLLTFSIITGATNYYTDGEVTFVVNIVALLLFGPLEVGMSRFLLKLSRYRDDVKFTDLFSGFDTFLKSVGVSIIVGFLVSLGTLLFVIPGIIATLMFSQVYYILAENPEISIMDCLKKSMYMMKGHKMELFILGISFIGWAFLSVLTFGIGALWLVPYIEVTITNFYLELQ